MTVLQDFHQKQQKQHLPWTDQRAKQTQPKKETMVYKRLFKEWEVTLSAPESPSPPKFLFYSYNSVQQNCEDGH